MSPIYATGSLLGMEDSVVNKTGKIGNRQINKKGKYLVVINARMKIRLNETE